MKFVSLLKSIIKESEAETILFGGNRYKVIEKTTLNIKDIDRELPSFIKGEKPISNLSRYINNPEILNDKQKEIYNKLKNKQSLGNTPILVSKSNELLDGYNRIKASLALGITDFDVLKVTLN
jgi:hypothetical protein